MFKETFKYYKSKKPPPSLENVVDFEDISKWSLYLNEVQSVSNSVKEPNLGLKKPNTWKIFELKKHPGLIFIKNPFTAIGQRYWAVRCLRDFPLSPNKTNLREKLHDVSKEKKSKQELRWATLGYHHNWDTKIYSEESKSIFPSDLAELSHIVSSVLGFKDFKAEAAIVNYYYFNSTLSGHTDHSEENLEAPLFSFSFGQPAIFLIGGNTLEDYVTPILIRSGDIIAMTKESRLCYHGVPKIIKDEKCSQWDDIDSLQKLKDENNVLELCFDSYSWLHYEDFLRDSRININVRQVLNTKQYCLNN
ncbi:hypothetical protein WA026_013967 [Henosepilachna vigintioctopunctata]|uniref:Alpha-ketoglutarate-dependent dioxygenase AlkB-like domain-containing protein n=1 Tax=Henosepilachna vigintioctopunctata TaxID=420089 RepID=A0AAW1U8I3_9CUCU